jgi:virginiamycin B lyase
VGNVNEVGALVKQLVLGWVVVAVVLAAACGRRGPDGPAPVALPQLSAVTEYVVPWKDAFPGDIVVDSTGRVWFTDRLTHAIGSFDPETAEFRRHPTPTALTAPYGLIAAPDGSLWFAGSRARLLGRVDPATGGIREYPLPDAEGGPHLLAWRAGEIWFSLREGRGYGRFDPQTGASTVYRLEAHHRPYSVAATRDAVWMSSYGAFRLLAIDPVSGVVSVHELATATRLDTVPEPAPGGRPVRRWGGEALRIVAAAGGGIWFTDFSSGRVVLYDPAAGTLRAFETLEPRSEPYGLTVTSRGLVVYGEKNLNRIVLLDAVTGERRRALVPTPGSVVRNIVVDEARGRIWLPLSDTGRLGRIDMR